jgi:hypothetical protein
MPPTVVREPRSALAAWGRALLRGGACVVVVAAFVWGLAAPGAALAADPFGIDQAQAEVDAAVAEAEALVPQETAAVAEAVAAGAGVVAAPPSTSAPQRSGTTGGALEFAANEAATAITSSAAAPTGETSEPSATAVTPLVATAPPAVRPRSRSARRVAPSTGKRPQPPRIERSGRSIRLFASSGHSFAATVVVSRATQATGHVETGRAPQARPARKASAGAAPQRPPPVPLPPRPGLISSLESGGQGLQIPLVVGALASALLIFAFQLLPRLLPRPAFRKPRRIALPPWHPG